MRTRIALIVFTLALIVALAACGGKATPAPTATPEPTATPTAVPVEGTPAAGGVDVALGLVTQPTGANVAVVNGTAISAVTYMGELERQLLFITDQYAMDWNSVENQAYLPQIEQQVFDQLVNVELAQQLAKAEGIIVSEDALNVEIETTKTSILSSGSYTDWANFLAVNKIDDTYFRDRIRESLIIDELVAAHGGPTEAEQVHAQHILVADEETAKKVLEELKAGKTFEELATTYSTDTGTKDSGGDLGWFPKGAMVAAFEEVAFSLPIGQVSDPVKSDYGYHIIKVLGKEVRPLDATALETSQQQTFGVWFQEQKDKAKVETLLTIGQ